MKNLRGGLVAAATIALAGMLAACSSSSGASVSSASAVAPAASASTSTPTSGGAEALAGKNVGVMASLSAAEVQARTLASIQAGADAFGWQTTVVDGEGDPSKMQQRLQSLIDSKVDAIVLVFPVPAIIGKQLEAAQAAGIPVVSAGFVTDETPLIAAQYVGDQVKMSTMLTDRIKEDFPNGGEWAIINIPGYVGVDQRVNTFKEGIASDPNFQIVAEKDVPQADVFGGTTKAGVDILNANPNLSGFFSCCDFGGQALAPALQQTKRDVPVYSFYAVPSVLDLVRAGKVVVVESDEAKTGAMAVGALAAYWADGAPLDASADLAAFPLEYQIVDEANAPAAGEDVYPLDQQMEPFLAAWSESYGI